MLSKLLEVNTCFRGKRRIPYRISPFEKACKGAFKKCWHIRQKVEILLKKMYGDGVSVEADMRCKHGNTHRNLLPEAKRVVIVILRKQQSIEK